MEGGKFKLPIIFFFTGFTGICDISNYISFIIVCVDCGLQPNRDCFIKFLISSIPDNNQRNRVNGLLRLIWSVPPQPCSVLGVNSPSNSFIHYPTH